MDRCPGQNFQLRITGRRVEGPETTLGRVHRSDVPCLRSGRAVPRMASIEKRTRNGQVRWYMRYRDPAGVQRNKTFDRKVDAERFLTTVESAKLTGSYIDPAASRLTVGMWAQRWLEGQTHLKPSTRERYAGILR